MREQCLNQQQRTTAGWLTWRCGVQDFECPFQESGDAAAIAGAIGAQAAPPPASGGGSHSDEYRTMVVVLASVQGSLLLAIVVGTVVAVRQWRRVANPFISVRSPCPTTILQQFCSY